MAIEHSCNDCSLARYGEGYSLIDLKITQHYSDQPNIYEVLRRISLSRRSAYVGKNVSKQVSLLGDPLMLGQCRQKFKSTSALGTLQKFVGTREA
jgi:hypothetical protein